MDYGEIDSENTAIKTIKRMIADGVISQEDAEKYCPELIVSKDEDRKYFIELCDRKLTDGKGLCLSTRATHRLKNFLEKLGEQNPAWSEEDENMFKTIANSLDRGLVERVWHTTIKEVIDWLRYLKNRVGCEVDCTTSWKPSGSQMKWLHDAIVSTQYEPRKQALISLYSDLMGLKD